MTQDRPSPSPGQQPQPAQKPDDRTVLLRGVNLLEASGQPSRRADVLIRAGQLAWISSSLQEEEPLAAMVPDQSEQIDAGELWLGPALVDPHSVLEDPLLAKSETLASLAAAAAAGGYGTVALLPWGPHWRDRPQRLNWHWPEPLRLLLWGSFSLEGQDRELAGHGDQIAAGAVGLSCGDQLPPLLLLERGLRLGEMGDSPVLLAPRDGSLCQQGFVRERVEALRAGWPVDPAASEMLPLELILGLQKLLPNAPLRLMNISTLEAVERLARQSDPPPASVHWWHLLADSGRLDPVDEGWLTVPSLGGPQDRQALIGALASGLIQAVAVHHQALDAEDGLLPLDQRGPGLAGHGEVLPRLWQALVLESGWRPEQLWQALCWGPANFLGLAPARVETLSRNWILFDPTAPVDDYNPSLAANRPSQPRNNRGALVGSGLRGPGGWWAPGFPRC